MWTLFDPLVKPTQCDCRVERETGRLPGLTRAGMQTRLERLWCLLEPTGPLSCKSEPPTQEES